MRFFPIDGGARPRPLALARLVGPLARAAAIAFVRAAVAAIAAAMMLQPAPARAAYGFGLARPLNADAATDTRIDADPRLAADGHGHWMAIWSSSEGVMASRSSNFGATWSAPAPIAPHSQAGVGDCRAAAIETDREGVWVAEWQTYEYSVSHYACTRTRLWIARSLDLGASWSEPILLGMDDFCILYWDRAELRMRFPDSPQLKPSTKGRWIAAWTSLFESPCGTAGTGNIEQIAGSVSADGGLTWSPRFQITSATDEVPYGYFLPVLATAERTSVLIANSYPCSIESPLMFQPAVTRSTDGGDHWSEQTLVGVGNSFASALATDGRGVWIASGGEDQNDAYQAASLRSEDDGLSWSALAPFNPSSPPSYTDVWSNVAHDRGRGWISIWQTIGGLGGALGGDVDLLVSHSSDGGKSWRTASPLNLSAPYDRPRSGSGQWVPLQAEFAPPPLVSDGHGRWMAAWSTTDDPEAAAQYGTDGDIFFTTSANLDAPAGAAEVVRIDAPAAISPGKAAAIRLVLRNDGAEGWSAAADYKLAVTSDPCHLWRGAAPRIELPPGAEIKRGEEAAFDIPIVAPAAEQSCQIDFQMVQEFFEFFGETARATIEIRATNAARAWTSYE